MSALMTLPPQSTDGLLDLSDQDMERLCKALQNVSFGMNYAAARIVDQAKAPPVASLSAKQRNALIRIGQRFRRQLSRSVAALAASARPTPNAAGAASPRTATPSAPGSAGEREWSVA